MERNPYMHATLAALYIVLIVLTIQSVTAYLAPRDTILIPIVMLSLFVLSAAIMGFLFVYEPARLFLDGKKQEGLVFFARTVGTFACCAVLFLLLLFFTGL